MNDKKKSKSLRWRDVPAVLVAIPMSLLFDIPPFSIAKTVLKIAKTRKQQAILWNGFVDGMKMRIAEQKRLLKVANEKRKAYCR